MKRALAILVATTALSSAALAASDPSIIPAANDTRVRTVDRTTSGVMINLTATDMTPITVTFLPGASVVNVAGLYVVPYHTDEKTTPDEKIKAAQACAERANQQPPVPVWCANWNGNEVTLQPLHDDPGSMLLITMADPNGQTHSYNYRLSTRKGEIGGDVPCKMPDQKDCYDDKAYFHVVYTDKASEQAEKVQAWRAAQRPVNQQLIKDRLLTDTSNTPRNYKPWYVNKSKDCDDLAPRHVFDDGRQTFMEFSMNAPMSIPTYPEKDGETAANFTSDILPNSGRKWTFPIVPQVIYLRRDKEVCGVYNMHWDKNAGTPYTGTSSPNVVRETK